MDKQSTNLKKLPAIDRLIHEPLLEELQQRLPRSIVLEAAREIIAAYREKIAHPSISPQKNERLDLSPVALAVEVAALADKKATPSLCPVINASGVVIHTNLGRAPLSNDAADAINKVAKSYNNLELNLESGKRGSRQEHLEELLCHLSGAEAAAVVNNNAAAVFLGLNTIAFGREVIVSRGQLVEIGGSFRIPEIMAASGAHLVEVGTTNKTYLRDYEAALNDNTAALLKVHTSNYHMVGFTAEVATADLAALARKSNLILIEDLGSGVFLTTEKYNLPPEPRVQDSISAGADLVTFSGDKMLGGPQAGIILGRKDLIKYIRNNQLARTLRVDKFTVAALEATLRLYLDEEKAVSQIPVWRMLTEKQDVIKKRAEKLAALFTEIFPAGSVSVIEEISKVGGGALPTAELPTCVVAVRLQSEKPETFVEKLRRGDPPVIIRLQQESLLFDPRTIFEEEEDLLIKAIKKALAQ